MKKYIKIYLISFFISTLLIALPWILGVVNLLSFIDVLETFALLGAIIAILVSFLYIVQATSSWKSRIILFLLNPALYYLFFWVYMCIILSQTEWTGWEKLSP